MCVSTALLGQWGSEWGSTDHFAAAGIPWGFNAGPLQCLCDETGWVQPRILGPGPWFWPYRTGLAPPELLECVCEDPAVGKQE